MISSNSSEVVLGNKHNAIVFYKNKKVVRLAVLMVNTDVEKCVENALSQKVFNLKLKDLLKIKHIFAKTIDMKQQPVNNRFNGQKETDIGSCDRLSLLQCMLRGDYTESETAYGNYDCNEYDFFPEIEIEYNLKTDEENFEIEHKGAFINKTKTRAIIIQSNSEIKLDEIK